MQEIFLDSAYFSPNMRRLFLFEANTPEEVSQALAPKDITVQELEQKIREIFSGCEYWKISYYRDRKEVLLQFDYPDSVNREEFERKADAFREATDFAVRISPSMNHNSAGLPLRKILPMFQNRKWCRSR